MPSSLLTSTFGPASRNLLADATDPGRDGALAALESFYYALNNRDADALARVWSDNDLIQLNNPLGGILRGREPIVELYRRVFDSPATLDVTFGDIVEYLGPNHAVFAGRETGHFTGPDGTRVPLAIRSPPHPVPSRAPRAHRRCRQRPRRRRLPQGRLRPRHEGGRAGRGRGHPIAAPDLHHAQAAARPGPPIPVRAGRR